MGTGPKRAVWIVTDMFKTYNLAGDLVKIRYGAKKPYISGHIFDNDVCAVSIARSREELLANPGKRL